VTEGARGTGVVSVSGRRLVLAVLSSPDVLERLEWGYLGTQKVPTCRGWVSKDQEKRKGKGMGGRVMKAKTE